MGEKESKKKEEREVENWGERDEEKKSRQERRKKCQELFQVPPY